MQHLSDKVISWASVLEEQAREQALQTGALPFIFHHVAVMPDAHYGMGATIGSVVPTQGAIIPSAVGVDIGCGMAAVRTMLTRQDLNEERLKAFRELVRKTIPTGIGKSGSNKLLNDRTEAAAEVLREAAPETPNQWSGAWDLQIGTLGSGNHFLEVDVDEEDRVWVILHTGSRGVGLKIATTYTKLAEELCKRWYAPLPNKDLAFLPQGESAFRSYIAWMTWAQAYARANRDEIVERALGALSKTMATSGYDERLDCHHNFAALEHHWGQDIWVTRKGAVRAREGDLALIPGSMGTPSYIVAGKGSRLAFDSAPHGAGRTMSRRKAFETLSLEEERAKMAGILWEDRQQVLDETPGAYKDVTQVIADAADLVEIRHTLRPVLNIKGF